MGKRDTCETCMNYDERRGVCTLDRKEVELTDWCRHHTSEEDED